jgi:hypothetical protein
MKSICIVLPICLGLAACASRGRNTLETDHATQDLPDDLEKRFRLDQEAKPKKLSLPKAHPQTTPVLAVSAENRVRIQTPTSSKSELTGMKKTRAEGSSSASLTWPNRRPPQEPFWIGEKAVYEVTYFGVPAAYFTMTILPFQFINGRKVYHSRSYAESHPLFRLVYRLDDTVDTFFDYEGLFSHRFQMNLDETKQKRETLELYDHEQARVFYRNYWAPNDQAARRSEGYFPMPRFSQDSVSSLYFLRGVPLKIGDKFEFEVAQEGKHFQALITVEGREKINSKLGEKDTIRLRIGARINGQLKKPDDNFMWVTDDDRRICLRLEAKVKIGTIAAVLKSFEPGESPTSSQPEMKPETSASTQ